MSRSHLDTLTVLGAGVLGDVLHERERHAYLGGISRSTDELAEVDCVWYIRGKLAFLPAAGARR